MRVIKSTDDVGKKADDLRIGIIANVPHNPFRKWLCGSQGQAYREPLERELDDYKTRLFNEKVHDAAKLTVFIEKVDMDDSDI